MSSGSVAEEIRALEVVKQQLLVVRLDVGGQVFTTSRTTLEKTGTQSPLWQLLENNPSTSTDGAIHVDRDPTYFRYILNYLRDGSIIPPKTVEACKELLAEAKYYHIPGLVEFLEDNIAKEEKQQAMNDLFSKDIPKSPSSQDEYEDDDDETSIQAPRCYMCKRKLPGDPSPSDILCASCVSLNNLKREQEADLTSMVALVTGGRIKIGYCTALKLLRCNATVVITTRFPRDAAAKFRKEPDFDKWADRLHIYGLDMRQFHCVEAFVKNFLREYHRLDILINNAAQTIHRPPAYYKTLIQNELAITGPDNLIKADDYNLIPNRLEGSEGGVDNGGLQLTRTLPNPSSLSTILSQMKILEDDVLEDDTLFPPGKVDQEGQPLDLREKNSWVSTLEQISPLEMLEVQMVNNIAPFVLVSQLKKLMNVPENRFANKFIINVSSVEGPFHGFKSSVHPHTNMAKAALNMLTRTCSIELAKERIFINSVDTGWISKLYPQPRQVDTRQPPLTVEDGAARILDPIFTGLHAKTPVHGRFFKHFKVAPW